MGITLFFFLKEKKKKKFFGKNSTSESRNNHNLRCALTINNIIIQKEFNIIILFITCHVHMYILTF